jgi:hypothetical protein
MANRLNGGRRAALVFLVQRFWTETRTGDELDQLVGGHGAAECLSSRRSETRTRRQGYARTEAAAGS